VDTNHIQKLVRNLADEIEQLTTVLEFIRDNQITFETLNLPISPCDGGIDFDNLQRPDVLRVIKAFPGCWEKSINYEGGLNYTRLDGIGGITLRLWGAEAPPDSCKIEEPA
jgi:hypothetical protein